MIVDHISNRAFYYSLGDDYKKALDFFASVESRPFDKADIVIPGTDILVKARPMSTKPAEKCAFEAHRLYADIHFVAYGEERIGYADIRNMRVLSYDAAKDAAAVEGTGDLVLLRPGYFLIALPQDAHMPCVAPAAPAPLGKMIAKIRIG